MVGLRVNMFEKLSQSVTLTPPHTISLSSSPASPTMTKTLDVAASFPGASTYASSDCNDEDLKDDWCNPDNPIIVR